MRPATALRRLGIALLLASCVLIAVPLGAGAQPPPPSEAAPPETVALRSRLFGAEHVDQATGALPRGELHLSWLSVATFAVALDGQILLFDAYIHKEEEGPNYVPATTQDLIDLQPTAILVGHGHFDHALEAGRIAAETGAVVVGTQQHCDQATEQAAEIGAVACEVVFPADAAYGDVTELTLADGICTTAVLHVHSAQEPPDPDHDHTNVVVPVLDPGSALLHPPGSLFGTEGDEGGTVLYQLRRGDFALTYHDSAGPLKEQAPHVLDILADLPPTDLQVGAILGFNQPTNGLRDPAMYIDALSPTVFVPNHHDFVTEYGSADDFEPVLQRELDARDEAAEVRFLYDPYDYARPGLLRFDLEDQRWAGPEASHCAVPTAQAGDGAGRAAGAPAQALLPLPATGGGLAAGGLLLALGWSLGRRERARQQDAAGAR